MSPLDQRRGGNRGRMNNRSGGYDSPGMYGVPVSEGNVVLKNM